MKKTFWHTPRLQLFAGEGEAISGETGDNFADAGQDSATEIDLDSQFNDLIGGKFKEQFSKKTQAIIDKRFKTTKELEAYKERISPIISGLSQQYGVSEDDIDGLAKAFRERGAKDTAEKDAKTLSDKDSAEKSLRRKIGNWINQSRELQKHIPDFDLRTEIRANPQFGRLLLSGLPLKTVYDTVHRDRILSDAVAYTADKVRRQVVHGIEARGMRPVENGVSSEGAVVTAVDVNSLTSQDILKILKQVESGAHISF